MLQATELKVGRKVIFKGAPYEIVSYDQKVVGRGGSIVNVKMKNLLTGGTIPETFGDSDIFEEADIVTKTYDYLYNDGENYYFMDINNYEQVSLGLDIIGDSKYFLSDGDKVMLQEFNGKPININLEPSVVLEVMETPPGERGDTATGGKKPATLSTGLVIQVPLFVAIGDKLKVDTRTKIYLGRA
ncbi:elongation factor P [Candidatus Gracilibacteria bacterium]|nr:elongation factor P [Candidatus Gracilibacteria bacterium]NUJ98710.1 elongation factor P [Candidatus Gracilibacteria bacterium]